MERTRKPELDNPEQSRLFDETAQELDEELEPQDFRKSDERHSGSTSSRWRY